MTNCYVSWKAWLVNVQRCYHTHTSCNSDSDYVELDFVVSLAGELPPEQDPRLQQDPELFRNLASQAGRGKGKGKSQGRKVSIDASKPVADGPRHGNRVKRKHDQCAISLSSSDHETEPMDVPDVPAPVVLDAHPVATVDDVAPAAAALPVVLPAPVAVPQPDAATLPDVSVEPRVNNEGHRHVIRVALPYLLQVMQSKDWCTKAPRQQVRRSLSLVDNAGKRFWGKWELYSRKWTVEDLILQFYFDSVKALL